MKNISASVIASVTLWVLSCSAFAAGELYEDYTLLALSAADDRAILKTPAGAMVTIKAGDSIEGLNAAVVQVLDDKIVIKEHLGDTVWLYKSSNGKSRHQRIFSRIPAEQSQIPVTLTHSVIPEKE